MAFENEEDRSSYSVYYTPTVEIKDYYVILDGQEPFYGIPIKNKAETYKAITELIRDKDFTTGNGLDYEYFSTWYKLIVVDLSKQKNDLEDQQINFISKLEQNAIIFFIIDHKKSVSFRIFTKFFVRYCIKMESQKITKLLEQTDDEELKFQTKKWYITNDQNNGQYSKGDQSDSTIKFSTEIVKCFLEDYSDAYILVTGDIKVVAADVNTNAAFKNCYPFIRAVIHLNDEHVDTAENLDLGMICTT